MEREPVPAYVTLEPQIDEGGRVVRIGGELDLASRDLVEPEVLAAIAHGGPVTIDLTDLTFCDSSGIALLLAAREKATAEDVALTIEHVRSSLARVLALTGVDRVIDIRGEVAD
jgi:anti-sigma B factor antagonist